MNRKFALALLLLAIAPLTGCAMAPGHMMNDEPSASATNYNSGELMFAQMMIPHHKQAVLMSELAEGRTTNKEILDIASHIKAAQQPEIDQMTRWLTSSGLEVDTHHSMMMSGMLTDAEFQTLKAATGVEFEKLYLSGMIKHHQGAISMLSMIENSTNSEVATLRENIRRTQTAEINQMQDLLKKY